MATSSTSKKIQRVQRAGVTRSAGQRRPLGFPAAVVAIVVIGTALVLWARDARLSANEVKPAVGDTWHAAFGVYVCDKFINLPGDDDALTDVTKDTKGIQANGDGLIRIAPTSADTAGNNAVLGQFFAAVGLEVGDTGWTHQPVNGPTTSHQAGEPCTTKGKDGSETQSTTTEVKLLIFPPQASDKTKPAVTTTNLNTERLAEDGQAFVLALVPADADVNEIGLPPSISALDDPGDPPGMPAKEKSEDSGTTTTVAPGSTTTAGPATTTTVPATTTTAG